MRVRSRAHKRWVGRALQHCKAGYGSPGGEPDKSGQANPSASGPTPVGHGCQNAFRNGHSPKCPFVQVTLRTQRAEAP